MTHQNPHDSTHHDAGRAGARTPEDITRLFVERSNDGDADGVADLYEEDAVMAFPPGQLTVGRAAIRQLWAQFLADRPHFEYEDPRSTLIADDIALTATPSKDGTGERIQVVRRQADGTWQRLIDRPEQKRAGQDQAGDQS